MLCCSGERYRAIMALLFMNPANKKEGACLYNKRLTSTLNTLPQELVNASLEAVEGANDRSKYMCFMINRYNQWGSNARSEPSETNVSASEVLFVFIFFCFLLVFFRDDVR